MADKIRGKVFVVGDNIDTDQIIPAQYLNLVPTIPDEYEKLGSYALCGLPDSYPRFVPAGQMKTPYAIVIAGRNFGCGSSREHAPVSLGAAGVEAVVAESYARIFFRNAIATGELYPVECATRLCEELKTGDEVELDLTARRLCVVGRRREYETQDLGEAKAVIDHGGLFEFARGTGMMARN
ncbi:MAG: 3-isopropylmalate dehydratase [Lentisphaerae bacterium RIFOXYB12_FULL_65_16]|nr:MAG: 3-isopropylmalate dehydratase [Lentisphaerae bacterium RIFOXYA12_64_32]OGV84566.1 MAG: 3-isopropylmalate dehydratase [Lentisphaerae bacterium RIFOXYB12_FULL_65_16]